MSAVEPPLPEKQRGMGCVGKGCLTGFGLVVLLLVAFIGGSIWAVHHLRQTYSASEPLALPEETSEDNFVASAPTAAPATALPAPPVPGPTVAPPEKRWKEFEKAKNVNTNANIILTAAEINALLSASKNTRGKVFVSIANNVGHVRVSIPLKEVFMMEGRYLNGEATVVASPDGNPMSAQITNIILNNQPVPDSVLDRRLFGWSSMRMEINKWLSKQRITSFKIEDNKVIGEKQGGGGFE